MKKLRGTLCKLLLLITTGFIFGLLVTTSSLANILRQANTDVELVSEVTSLQPGESFWIALRMKMDPGWHVYWRNPGDSGYAPKLDWQLPIGFEAGPIQWPYPEGIEIPPLISYGYEKEVFLLTEIKTPNNLIAGTTVILKAQVKWLACKIECVPGLGELNLSLLVANYQPSYHPIYRQQFELTRTRIPQKYNPFQFEAVKVGKDYVIEVLAPVNVRQNISNMQFFPYTDDVIEHSAKQIFSQTDGGFELKVQPSVLAKKNIELLEGVLIVSDQSTKAYQVNIPVSSLTNTTGVQSMTGLSSLGIAMAFALLGGLILNLMPCVLPVLSIKILNLVEQTGSDKKQILKHGLFFTAGIIVSFWVLAGMLVIFKSLGQQVGWGFQFQSPVFVVSMTMLFFALGLNLFGIYEIGTSLTRIRVGNHSFYNGILTTIVATPCTAPFMGSALAYALVQSPLYTFFVFTCLGLGLALPYLMISMFPILLKVLPKPGPWMDWLKKFFGSLFMLTVVWLAWVLWMQKGMPALIWLSLGLVLLTISLTLWGQNKKRPLSLILMVFAVGLSILMIMPMKQADLKINQSSSKGLVWQKFSKELINQSRSKNKPVFLDFTASWCLSCQVNKRIALDNQEVVNKFQELGVILVRADWTNADEQITQALAEFGKNSIPLYVFYPKGEKEPVLLPEIITPRIVLEILNNY